MRVMVPVGLKGLIQPEDVFTVRSTRARGFTNLCGDRFRRGRAEKVRIVGGSDPGDASSRSPVSEVQGQGEALIATLFPVIETRENVVLAVRR